MGDPLQLFTQPNTAIVNQWAQILVISYELVLIFAQEFT